jgi:hypothetical protein
MGFIVYFNGIDDGTLEAVGVAWPVVFTATGLIDYLFQAFGESFAERIAALRR